MIYENNKMKHLFDSAPTIVNEDGVELGKFIYSLDHKEEVENIPYDKWNVVHKNGNLNDFRSSNLKLVIFED